MIFEKVLNETRSNSLPKIFISVATPARGELPDCVRIVLDKFTDFDDGLPARIEFSFSSGIARKNPFGGYDCILNRHESDLNASTGVRLKRNNILD